MTLKTGYIPVIMDNFWPVSFKIEPHHSNRMCEITSLSGLSNEPHCKRDRSRIQSFTSTELPSTSAFRRKSIHQSNSMYKNSQLEWRRNFLFLGFIKLWPIKAVLLTWFSKSLHFTESSPPWNVNNRPCKHLGKAWGWVEKGDLYISSEALITEFCGCLFMWLMLWTY